LKPALQPVALFLAGIWEAPLSTHNQTASYQGIAFKHPEKDKK
jgi:hypothetical protein